jgi:hypothetical protein
MTVVLLAGLLAACASGQDTGPGLSADVFGAVREVVKSRRDGPPPVTIVTPQMLAQTTTAALQVNPEVKGGSDFLRRVAARNDSVPGTVEVWNSSDNAQIFLRNGVVVGTRGIGGDIIAADANVTVRALRTRAATRGIRVYTVSDGDATSTAYTFQCTISRLGTEQISIVNLAFVTEHMVEECTGGSDGKERIRNDYWVQSSDGLVRKSRQWVGPRTGYFELVLLKN